MDKRNKMICRSIALAISISLLLGCSGKSVNNYPNKQLGYSAQTGTSGVQTKKDVTLNYIGHDNTFNRELKKVAPEFEKETGIKVVVEPLGQQLFEQRIQLDFAGNTGSIDAVYMPAPFVQKWAKAGWAKPLDELVKQDEQKININDFVASTLEAMKYDKKLYALPAFAEVGMMAYRKDILQKNGFNEPPKTWDELLTVVEKIKSSDSSMGPFVARAQRGQGLNMFIFPMFMWGYGGSFYNNYPNDMTPVLDSDKNVKALEVYSTLINKYGPQGAGNFSYPEVISAMQSGKAAIAIDGSSTLISLLDPTKNKFANQTILTKIPAGPAGITPCNVVHGMAVSNFSKNSNEALQFIEWATSSETLKKMALGTENYTDYPRESVANDKEVMAKYNKMNFTTLRMESLKAAKGDYRPLTQEWDEIGDVIGTYVNYAANGAKDAATAMKEANEDVTEIVKRAGYIK
jgi:ABC-type glycerol-3-phosphate transport system substrate-binding protein